MFRALTWILRRTPRLIEEVERLLGDFYRSRGFVATCGENQRSLWGTLVWLKSERFVITISRDRGYEGIDINVRGREKHRWPIGHLVAYLEGRQDPCGATSLETEAEWLQKYADQLLDESLITSPKLQVWAEDAARRKWGDFATQRHPRKDDD